MLLNELLRAAGVDADVRGDPEVGIEGLAYDSRAVTAGSLFFCVTGLKSDGHEFAPQAVEAGAAALVVERTLELDVPQVQVEDARAAMAPLSAAFHGAAGGGFPWRSDGGDDGGRDHRDQRQDDHGVPRP
jgi:UDP-N-acetylmuramyl tripeptide synthase